MTELQRIALVEDGRGPGEPRRAAEPAHVVQFYEDDAFLADTVTRFLGAGLVAGESAVVIATSAHRESFTEALRARGFDIDRACQGGKLVLLDAGETVATFMDGSMPDWDRFQVRIGSVIAKAVSASECGRVRAYGEMVDLLWRDANPKAALQLEKYWNELARLQPFTLLCAYVMGNFYQESHGEAFAEICGAHTRVIPTETYAQDADRDTRLREISILQQRARALETELQHRRQLEQALRAARESAEAASQAKDEFLAMLGHELRNPLSPILTALELMKLRGDGTLTREQEVIDRQTRHLIRLVDDLLDVSRITRGKVELRKETIDLRDILAKATEIASPLLEQRRHHFEVRVPPRGMKLDADEARLAQVIANLLTNAAKYTEPGGHIAVIARRDGKEISIEVLDDGVGITADLLPRVFDLFVQGRQPADRASGGLGIGLALVRNLVALHGGTVEARSAGAGKGSSFVVRLPAKEDASEAALPFSQISFDVDATRRRVLVVDDNEDALEMLKEMLLGAGHEVRGATSGPIALQIVKEFKPDVAILDIGLPAMDGYELAMRLRTEMGPHAPCLVALSGYGQESDRARSKAAGFALHLVKPLEASQLLASIDDQRRT